MSESESSPSTHAGTRLGSVGNSPPIMKWWSKLSKCDFCFTSSWPQLASSPRTYSCGWWLGVVGFVGRSCSNDGALGSKVEGLESNRLYKRSVSLVFTAIMSATG